MKQFNTDTEEMEMPEDYKPTYIHEQHNNNCQQFFGPITNCTFTMPAAKPSSSRKPKATKQKNAGEKKLSGKPKTLKYYTSDIEDDEKKARKERVEAVFRLWAKWEWIDKNTIADDFHSFFKGHDRHCNITWTTNAAILTLLLQGLIPRKDVIAEQTGCHPNSLVIHQFGFKKADYRDVDEANKKRIDFTIFVLDVNHSFQEIYKEAKNKMSEADKTVMKEFADEELKKAMEEEAKIGNAHIRKSTWG